MGDYKAAKEAIGVAKATLPDPIPTEELLDLALAELHNYTGDNGGRILMSIKFELLDVSAGREMYGPGGGYSLFAGRDVTRCLGTMSLEPESLDDLNWEPDSADEEAMIKQWSEKLKDKYPVAGRLKKHTFEVGHSQEGVRKRALPTVSSDAASKVSDAAAEAKKDNGTQVEKSEKCPISGKEGAGCPMAAMGILPAKPKGDEGSRKKGFMAGKSLVASVQKDTGRHESFIWALCPVHWDAQTLKLLAIVAICSCVSGMTIGWALRARLMA